VIIKRVGFLQQNSMYRSMAIPRLRELYTSSNKQVLGSLPGGRQVRPVFTERSEGFPG